MLPQKIVDKNGVIWGIPKYVITNLKINNFKGKKQENFIAIFLSQTNLHRHVSIKINTFKIDRGVWGASPPEAEEIFKKIKQNGGFSLFFLLFGKAPYIPKIMSLLPSSPKIMTSAPKLPENK